MVVVLGLYGRLDIWYAGIVAEMPCTDNRNRFLIFFDDGFAQYLSSKKLHKVHHKGTKKLYILKVSMKWKIRNYK